MAAMFKNSVMRKLAIVARAESLAKELHVCEAIYCFQIMGMNLYHLIQLSYRWLDCL